MVVTLLLLLRLGLAAALLLLLQTHHLALVETLDELLHRHGGEYLGHIECELKLPARLGGEELLLLVVLVELGTLALSALDHITRVPLAVAVHILDDADAYLARRDIVYGVAAAANALELAYEFV